MRAWRVICLAAAVLAVSVSAFAAQAGPAAEVAALPEPLRQALVENRLTASGLSIHVQELGQERPLLDIAADTPRNPASTIKLVTTLAALELLGPAYRWKQLTPGTLDTVQYDTAMRDLVNFLVYVGEPAAQRVGNGP